ncbi:MAG: hypothetical protein Q4F55_05205, partial [Bacillota bacterium]|nr:hypothetical protein [Bacillota bacterium]
MKFDEKLFNEIMKSEAPEKLLIVPAQQTLSAEEAAFDVLGKSLGKEGFFDFHIMSGNKLRSEILSKVGGPGKTMIDALGRSMILRKCVKELADSSQLSAYSSVASSGDFLNGAGDFIVQSKQNLAGSLTGLAEPDTMLGKKLCDMAKISESYESYMQGKYIDSEDGLLYVTEKLPECDWVKNSEIWFAGFYSFTKREQEFLKALDKESCGCHVLLSSPKEELPSSFEALIKAESTNKEAEIIASEILRLIREEKIDAEDIVILSANLAEEGPIFKRIFDSIGIRNFVDEKRSLMHQEAASKIALLLDMAADGLKTNTVVEFVADEDFTNYCKSYHVKNNAFLTNFKYGAKDKIAAEIKRGDFATLVSPFIESFNKAETTEEKTRVLYEFLIGPFDMPGKLKEEKRMAEDLGYKDYSEELSQIWAVVIHILDQAVELLGPAKITNKEYRDLIKNAFKDIKIGLLPQEANSIMIGDLYRSKITKAKVVFVSGFSEGFAPRTGNASKILTNEEIDKLSSAGISLCKDLKQIVKEDKIMIFEAFEKASEKLYIAYAFADNDGKEKGQSYLLRRLINGEVKVLDEDSIDIYSIENLAKILLKCKRTGEDIPANW